MNEKAKHYVANLLAWGAMAVGVAGLLMRYAVKDRIPALALLFYGLPPSVVTLLFAMSLALGLRRPRRRARAAVPGVFLVIALTAWIQTDFVWVGSVAETGDPLRVVSWNVSRPSATDASFIPLLQQTDADVLFLAECGSHSAARQRFWQSHFPDYHINLLPGQIALLSKYPIVNVHHTTADCNTVIAEYDLDLPNGTLSLVGVDVASSQCHRRRYSFDSINAIVGSKTGPILVLGDFNTPHTSILFDALRASFRQTFEASGRGLITTWLSLLPMLALDHIWVSEGLTPVRTVLRRTLHSDHAMVIADLSIAKPQISRELVSSVER